MLFSHREDPRRTASITIQPGEPAVVVVVHTDPKGARRTKTFKNAVLFRAHDAALRFLLNQERYIIRGPQDGDGDGGPLLWMTKLLQDYRGALGHAADPRTGVVWVIDALDHAHRIEPGTCATVSAPLGSAHTSPACLAAAGADDVGWVVALSWARQPDGRLLRVSRLLKLVPQAGALRMSAIAEVTSPRAMTSLCTDRAGRVLGPHADGAGLYTPDGALVASWPLEPLGDNVSPQGAMSQSGEWLALVSAGRCLRVHLPSARTEDLAVEVGALHRVQVTDHGRVFLGGFVYPNYATFALGPDGLERVSPALSGVVDPTGRVLLETGHNTVLLRDLGRRDEHGLAPVVSEVHLPVLGMAKTGHAVFGRPGEVVILTDAYTVAGIALSTP